MNSRRCPLKEGIKEVIGLLKDSHINGCITGSSMLDADFDMWEEAPDIDLFVYTDTALLSAANWLMFAHGFMPASDGEKWKYDRLNEHGIQRNSALSSLKVKKDVNGDGDIIVNIVYKKGKSTVFDVLASFDMSIIMVGYDIRTKVTIDLRVGWNGMVDDPDHKWSTSPMIAVPNPIRKQDVDMYGTEMWVRQWSRVVKYWNRGYDTRPMAKFYIRLIDGVIAKGQLFASEKSENAYNEFVGTYKPLRDRMAQWLDERREV